MIPTPTEKALGEAANYSTNYQISGRELMTPDEVRMLDNRYALLFIRGERPVMDFKYDIMKHPNVKLTADGGNRRISTESLRRLSQPLCLMVIFQITP